MDDLKKIINQLGGSRVLSKKLGVRPGTVRTWITDGVPAKHHDSIIELGRLRLLNIKPDDLA